MKYVLRILCLPLVALCCIIKSISLLTIKCGCYILSPALMFLGVCCVSTIIRQQWDQTLLLLTLGSAGVLFLVAATLIVPKGLLHFQFSTLHFQLSKNFL